MEVIAKPQTVATATVITNQYAPNSTNYPNNQFENTHKIEKGWASFEDENQGVWMSYIKYFNFWDWFSDHNLYFKYIYLHY